MNSISTTRRVLGVQATGQHYVTPCLERFGSSIRAEKARAGPTGS